MVRVCFVLKAGLIAALLAGPTMAEEADLAAPGQARSMNFMPLTPATPVAIRPLDNSDANLTLKQHFAAALKRRAIPVQQAPAPLVLNFETEIDQAFRRPGPSLGSGSVSNRESEVRVNVWSTNQDSFLRARASDMPDRGLLRYVLTATLDDDRTGRRLWQGEATYEGAPADEAATLAAMATILVEQIGRTVRQRPFRLE